MVDAAAADAVQQKQWFAGPGAIPKELACHQSWDTPTGSRSLQRGVDNPHTEHFVTVTPHADRRGITTTAVTQPVGRNGTGSDVRPSRTRRRDAGIVALTSGSGGVTDSTSDPTIAAGRGQAGPGRREIANSASRGNVVAITAPDECDLNRRVFTDQQLSQGATGADTVMSPRARESYRLYGRSQREVGSRE